jgi:alpha-tubulin suppressor-like RCC1 family protein
MKTIQQWRRRFSKSVLVLLLLQATAIQAATTVTNIAAGAYHSLFLKSDGSLWATGDNYYGQLGDGTFNTTNRPEQIVSSGVIQIAGGFGHSLFVKSDGSLWGMGWNAFGQLGDHNYPYSTNRPAQIASNGVVAIAAGAFHSLFLKSDGSLWAMGDNRFSQLGDGTINSKTNQPEQIVSSGVVAIAAGYGHSLFLKSDGSLWAMGLNNYGQLGDGTFSSTNRPELIVPNKVVSISGTGNSEANSHSLFIKSDGSLWGMGFNSLGGLGDGTFNTTNRPVQITSRDVVAIAGGWSHSLFLKSDGGLWAMGDNNFGQLGDGTLFTRTNRPEQIVAGGVVAIAAGDSHSLFLRTDGSVWAMGHGQLGDGFTNYDGSFSGPGPYDYSFTNTYCLTPEQIIPSPQPVLTISISSGTNLQFKATCQFAGSFHLLTSTNLAQSRSLWTPFWTNSINARGTNNFTATLTNALNSNSGRRYYILRSQ